MTAFSTSKLIVKSGAWEARSKLTYEIEWCLQFVAESNDELRCQIAASKIRPNDSCITGYIILFSVRDQNYISNIYWDIS